MLVPPPERDAKLALPAPIRTILATLLLLGVEPPPSGPLSAEPFYLQGDQILHLDQVTIEPIVSHQLLVRTHLADTTTL